MSEVLRERMSKIGKLHINILAQVAVEANMQRA
jgi:hypothetical protein